MTALLYDGSFEGFLTCVFERYERRIECFRIKRSALYQPELGSSTIDVVTDQAKAKRVWQGLQKRLTPKKQHECFKAFLSEKPEAERLLTDLILYAFSSLEKIEDDFGHPGVIGVTKIAKQVHREKHRMEAFVRFQRTKDDMYFAVIRPDFNVLPLITSHFRDRYADQHWVIYDVRRAYGVNYDPATVAMTEVKIELFDDAAREFLPESICHEDEVAYQKLWRDYFASVNIGARKNSTLHIRHVPARYWRHLTEKRMFI